MTEFQVSFPGLGIFDLPIRRELVNIFGFSIYWYGVVAAIALATVMFFVLKRGPKFGFSQDDLNDYFLFLIPGSIVGARLYYVAFSFANFKSNLWSIIDIRSGGLAFYGGVIGGSLTLYFVCLYKKQSFIHLLGFLAPYLALGQGIGRIANFFNQEAFGTNTTLPWGMISNGTKAYLASLQAPNLDPNLPVHPTFLYEFLGNLLIFVLLVSLQNYLYARRKTQVKTEEFANPTSTESVKPTLQSDLLGGETTSAETAAKEPDTSALTLEAGNLKASLAAVTEGDSKVNMRTETTATSAHTIQTRTSFVLNLRDSGLSMALYCLLYGVLRFFVEGIRTDALFIGQTNLRVSQLLSLCMVVVGLVYAMFYIYQQQKEMK